MKVLSWRADSSLVWGSIWFTRCSPTVPQCVSPDRRIRGCRALQHTIEYLRPTGTISQDGSARAFVHYSGTSKVAPDVFISIIVLDACMGPVVADKLTRQGSRDQSRRCPGILKADAPRWRRHGTVTRSLLGNTSWSILCHSSFIGPEESCCI